LFTGLAVAGGTALAATVLAPEVVTGALLAVGAYGGYLLYQSVKADLGSGNSAGLAYSAGAFLGGSCCWGRNQLRRSCQYHGRDCWAIGAI
jgi:hypothetical protein